VSLISSSSLSTSVWQHVAVTWDDTSDTVSMYLNGALNASQTGVTTLNNANTPGYNLRFGGDATAYNRLTGYMDDIYFADYAKTSTQILDLMNVIPEPSSVTLMGLCGVIFLRRLRSANSTTSTTTISA